MLLFTVPVYTQTTANLCWEACARMLWDWKFKNLNGYAQKASNYLTLNTGLVELQMDAFYTSLGIRSLRKPKGANLRHALHWTPVIFTDIDKVAGHAMVLAGFNGKSYTVVNPCATYSIDFDSNTDVCAAGTLKRAAANVEKPLGNYMWYW